MKQYLLSVYQPDGEPPPAPVLEKVMRDVYVLGTRCRPPASGCLPGTPPADTATVLRVKDGNVLTTDGPFTEGKEHIGGFSMTKAPYLDAALEWGRKLARGPRSRLRDGPSGRITDLT